MHEQRVKWEAMVFNAKETDTDGIMSHLNTLFTSTNDIKAATEALWKSTKAFEASLGTKEHFNDDSLKAVVNGLLRSDLVTDEKKLVLKDFLSKKMVLGEVADVLNMRIKSLDKWKWDPSGTSIEQKRHLNGRYRFYADEDLLQMMLLRYLGLVWSVHFKTAFTTFRNATNVWRPSATPIPSLDRQRREFFLSAGKEGSVEELRKKHFDEEIFLEQLTGSMDEQCAGYDDDAYEKSDTKKSGAAVTQTLLHTLVTEVNILTRLEQDVCVVRSDFAWFGPSMPHSTIFAVLKFFKVSDQWSDFFRRAIQAPVRFGVDGKDAPVRTRIRGTPISGPLSDFLAETVLFCLDFSFNSSTNGLPLYRLHDDIWFWGQEEKCIKGWAEMKTFASLMGLEFSEEKTGCTKINRTLKGSTVIPSSLPKGDVQWGFLKLESDGRFVIDQAKVDLHIKELRRQLDNCKSILDWIQAWNVYGVRFFTTNFGKPANCYGSKHVDMLLETFARIQATLFSSSGGSANSTLTKMIGDRFGVEDIPEGYLFWPTNLGGLELHTPFVDLYIIRDSITKAADTHMDQFFREENQAYARAKTEFETGSSYSRRARLSHLQISSDDFFTFEEYTRYRLQASTQLHTAYQRLMGEPLAVNLTPTPAVRDEELRGYGLAALTSHTRWVLELYASEIDSRFGGLAVVEKGLLPVGLVVMFKESRFRWQS